MDDDYDDDREDDLEEDKEEEDFEEQREDLHGRYVYDQAALYLKDAEKNKADKFWTGSPILTEEGLVARAIITLVGDRTNVLFHEVDRVNRRELQEISEEIIAQAATRNVTGNLYERLQSVDRPQAQEELDDERIDQLNTEMRYYYGLAETWAEPDLTVLEACHGVARAAYAARFNNTIPRAQPVGAFNPNRVYDAYYDMQHAEQIKARKMRAARDLFGGNQ